MSPEELVPFARGCRHASHRLELHLASSWLHDRKSDLPRRRRPPRAWLVLLTSLGSSQPASRLRITSFVFIWRLSVLLFRVNKLFI